MDEYHLIQSSRQAKRRMDRQKRKLERFGEKVFGGDTGEEVLVNTLHKRKADKILPLDNIPSDGTTPEGDPHWKEKRLAKVQGLMESNAKYSDYITPKFSLMPRGTRIHGERLQGLLDQVKDTLSSEETDIFLNVMYNREAALAWDFSECGKVDPSVAPPQVIKTIDHSAWQSGNIPIPRALTNKVIDLLKERMKRGILEEGHGPYRNPFFLVSKKDGGLRLINSATRMNGVTIRDAFAPPSADDFSDEFAMCKMLSLLDFFSGYDQVPLDEKSRDYTTFSTPIGLLRMCTLPQGGTNSVAQFMRVITRILFDLISDVCRPFLDDIAVKGPETTYNDEEILPGVRRYVLEHLVNLDKVLLNVELSGCTVAGKKSQFCCKTAVIVGYLCGTNGRSPEEAKVIKIKEWAHCSDVTQVKAFLGLVGYYRHWIEYFAIVAAPLTVLLRKATPWRWGLEQQTAMEELKKKVTEAPILVTLDLKDGYGEVILMVDASLEGWGAVLMQVVDGKRHPIRFDSGIWTNAEKSYDATKRECRGILYAVRKLRAYITGLHFTLETDAQVLIHQLNGSLNDVPGSIIMRWTSYIMLFDFTVRHIPGPKNTIADALSRKPPGPSDLMDKILDEDMDEVIDMHLNVITFEGLDGYHSDGNLAIARYLTTLERPDGLSASQFRALRKRSLRYFVKGRRLWMRPAKNRTQPALVVDDRQIQKDIVRSFHKNGHRGKQVGFDTLRDRYWWPGLWNDHASAVSTCPICQKHGPWRPSDQMVPTVPGNPMEKLHFDTQYLPPDNGYRYLLEARCDLTGWVEAKPVKKLSSKAMVKFAQSIIYRFGVIVFAVVDGGPEFKKTLTNVLEDLGIKVIPTSGYNPKANGIVEGGHWIISSALSKMSEGRPKWLAYLDQALLTDRTSIRSSHGKSAFELLYGWQPVLPLEVEFPTWRLINWSTVTTSEQLFEARLQVLERKSVDVQAARNKVAEFRRKLADRQDALHHHKLRKTQLEKGDLVLLYDSKRATDMSTSVKLALRWTGPYRVHKQAAVTGAYHLETLDGIIINKTFSGDRIKYFVPDTSGWWITADDVTLSRSKDQSLLPDRHYEQATTAQPTSNTANLTAHSRSSSADSSLSSDSRAESTHGEVPLRPRRGPQLPLEVAIPQMTTAQKAEYHWIK